jgi:hypothetical protein
MSTALLRNLPRFHSIRNASINRASAQWGSLNEIVQVQEFIPIPLDDCVLDFHVLEEIEREGRRLVRLLLVAAQTFMTQQVVAAVTAAKLSSPAPSSWSRSAARARRS